MMTDSQVKLENTLLEMLQTEDTSFQQIVELAFKIVNAALPDYALWVSTQLTKKSEPQPQY